MCRFFYSWCKAPSFTGEDTDSACKLTAVIEYKSDGDAVTLDHEEFPLPFCPRIGEWQYAELQFSKTHYREVTRLLIYCEYNNSTGYAYFDSINLTRDYIETGLTEEDFEDYEDYEETTEDTSAPEEAAEGENANSRGCQLIYSTDYFDFGEKVGFLSSKPTTQAPTSHITSGMKGIIGIGSEFVNNGPIVRVKYILDRTYDEKNKAYQSDEASNCKNGVFYPINHICGEQCTFCE